MANPRHRPRYIHAETLQRTFLPIPLDATYGAVKDLNQGGIDASGPAETSSRPASVTRDHGGSTDGSNGTFVYCADNQRYAYDVTRRSRGVTSRYLLAGESPRHRRRGGGADAS